MFHRRTEIAKPAFRESTPALERGDEVHATRQNSIHSTAAGSMMARVELQLSPEAHMQRRDFLKAMPLAVLMPQLHATVRLKITGIRIIKLKVVRETGKMEA